MTISSLKSKMTPPDNPNESHGDWVAIENEIGTSIPIEYKEFINTYGSGKILDFLIILNPFSKRETINLISGMATQKEVIEELTNDYGEDFPYSIYPETDGLLPFAITDNGDVIYWLTNGSPDDWNIIINESRGPDFERIQLSTLDFIEKFVSGALNSDIIPNIKPPKFPIFKPI